MALPSQFVKGASFVPTSVKAGLEAGRIVKVPLAVAVPSGVVTDTPPVVEKSATVAMIVVALVTEKLAALLLPSFTLVAPVKSVPVIVTDDPWHTVV